MKVLEKRRTVRAEQRRIAELQAACDHDWRRVEKVKGESYYTFWCALVRNHSSTALKYQCRKCGKVEWDSV